MNESTIKVNFYECLRDDLLKYAVIISKYKGKWVFCKHCERDTYEIPGGKREVNEAIIDTAKRELYEETGAKDYTLTPICVYSVTEKASKQEGKEESFGMLYYAELSSLKKELHSEIEKIELFDGFPANWTYPLIQPLLIEEFLRRKMI